MYSSTVDNALLKNMRNLYVSYKHHENSFVLNFLNKNVPSTHEPQYKTIKHENGSEMLQFAIDRETMLKNVLTPDISFEKLHADFERKHIVIDFSSPNIAKPFHVGHLRSTIIGNFIANINKCFNNKVTKINYLGDWGTQFGLLQYGLQAKNIDVSKLKSNPIKCLYDTYVYANKLATTDAEVQKQARKYFSDIEQGKISLEKWKDIREITVGELENVYQRLGIQFDEYHWESDYNGGAIKHIIDLLENKNIITTDVTGKKVANVNNRNVTVLKSDNSTLYLSRDVAALLDRYKRYKFDKMLYVVDNAQTDHFAAVLDIVKQLDKECTEGCLHVKFGRIKGMSTRSGNVVFLNDILDEAKRKMYEKQRVSKNTRSTAMNEETCDILGTTAVIVNDLKQRRQKDYIFDWDRALQSEGDSGIKLQYLHCRLWSLEQNCGISLPDTCEPKCLPEEVIGEVVAELAKFEDILYRSHEEYEACIIVNYLFRLARYINKMFNELKVMNMDPDIAAQRLLVFHSARIVVKTGLEILGVKPLKEM
ncbi:probable arginine--tRNA ligase, mitochondrial [Achroia grisella]|uniref:probable arginine--tRNA ligase, mitochondrial n=1 Tax=Achroia grisella TaxID=688607 RepID=UPI0027D2BBAE|nr:probable arginine--tRNA ligase, mitochondrial [Achroia grisella]XP_059060150.1 probable arginine--tRNA ligase, mitochondrial [Achroia grisella]